MVVRSASRASRAAIALRSRPTNSWSLRSALWLLLLSGACQVQPYDPFPIAPVGGLPPDAFVRCCDLLAARELRIAERDPAAFRVQTHWGPLAGTRATAQQRVALFRHAGGLGLLVEVRYLRQGLLDGLPEWTSARPDPDLERELGEALTAALSAAAPPASAAR